jgi:Phage portal protein.
MFGLKTIRTKELDALREEIKGYYAAEEQYNEYMRIISPQLRGTQLESLDGLSREEMRNAYETIAPVMGVVNYIADNVGEVARYVELREKKSGKYIEHHWLLDLLDNPNDRFTRRRFFTAWAINRCVFGDAFVYAPVEPGAKRQVKRMYVLPGQRVIIDKGGLEAPVQGHPAQERIERGDGTHQQGLRVFRLQP